jgi:hypothetical protein
MIAFISSTAGQRYLEDNISCIGLPRGYVIKFRYDAKWVDDSSECVSCFGTLLKKV